MAKRTLSIEEISDRIQINDLLVRYTVAIDTKDWNLLDTCFTEDARCDYTASGGIAGPYPEVREWLAKALAPFSMTQHLIGNTVLELDGDSATARTMVHNPMGIPKEGSGLTLFVVGAYYNDKLVHTEDGWRIAERVEDMGFMSGAMDANTEVPK